MEFTIAVLPGDGIGPEVVGEGVRLLEAVGKKFGHRFHFDYAIVGGGAIDKYGTPLLDETLEMCKSCDAVLFGAAGGPKWDAPGAKVRPEQGLLALRKGLGLYANLRPVKVYPMLMTSSTLKPEALLGTDILVVRELTGGLYFGRPKRRWETSRGRRAVDTMSYSEGEIKRILMVGFKLALGRRKRLTSVDKANILETSRLWREIATETAKDYPDVALEHLLVDTCAMQLVSRPASFDVIVTENTFGDILTDEAAVLAGSMGMLPSASLGEKEKDGRIFGLYEPVHGSAPDIAGKDRANPIATVLSVAMMLRYSLGLGKEAESVERAVEGILEEGYRTQDIASKGARLVGTREMGELIAARI
ncbi:MAG: 3-isopropylmalate dehydrogenase [Chloroflexi bacterium]|nr:3-isopropylmalate dehydrogenase [Chloroflexota bacterium]